MKEKNNLKKSFVVLFLLLGFTFILTGCGKSNTIIEENNANDDNTQNGGNTIIVEPEDSTNSNSNELSPNNTMTNEKNFSMGEWKNNVYSNDFLGIKFNQPKGWTASSKEEIANMMSISAEVIDNKNPDALIELAKRTSVYYMMSKKPNTGENVIIMSDKPFMDVSIDYHIDNLKKQLKSVDNIKYEIVETLDDKLGNREYKTMTVNASTNNMSITQKYYVYKINKYFLSIIITSKNGKSGINEIAKYFE